MLKDIEVSNINYSQKDRDIRLSNRAFGGGGLTVWSGLSSQYRTAIHFVNGTVTN